MRLHAPLTAVTAWPPLLVSDSEDGPLESEKESAGTDNEDGVPFPLPDDEPDPGTPGAGG